MMRIMGLDYGSKTVGVAVSDMLGLTAQRREVIRRKEENKLRKTFARIETLIEQEGITQIVLGMPLHMDGSSGVRAERTLEFKERLERRTGLPVTLWDERLTSVEAEEIMDRTGVRGTRRKESVDMIAAEIILQDFLDSHLK